MKAMLFAAGLGTRLQNETSDKPKALVEVGGITLLQRAIEKLKSEGVEEIVVNVHHFADLIIDFIASKDWGIPIHISDERDKLLETGGGLKYAAPFFNTDDPILIYNVDIISNLNLKELLDAHNSSNAIATLVVRNRETQRYFKFDEEKQLVGWLNKKTGENKIAREEGYENGTEMAFSGIHMVDPVIFDHMPAEDRFSIVKVYLDLAKSHALKGYFDTSDTWIDVGKPAQLAEARALFNLK